MVVRVAHTTTTTEPDSGDGKISSNAWNEDHAIVGLGTAAEADTTDFAAAVHTHVIANVTGLQAALDAKADDTDLSAYATTASLAAYATTASLGYFATGTDAANLTGTVAAARIADASLSIAKTSGLQAALDAKLAILDDSSNWVATFYRATVGGLSIGDNSAGGTVTIYQSGDATPGAINFDAQNFDGGASIGGVTANNRLLLHSYGTVTAYEFDANPYVGTNVIYHAGNLNLTGDVTSVGLATTLSSATVVSKVAAQALAPASVAATGAITSSGGGIGYATGAGGTVSQATSKATAVTLDKLTGQITMNAAALAAATVVTFTLNNSTIAASDMIVVSHHSGGTIGPYLLNGRATGAGTASIAVRNTSAGSLSEAIVLKFAVIKAVTS